MTQYDDKIWPLYGVIEGPHDLTLATYVKLRHTDGNDYLVYTMNSYTKTTPSNVPNIHKLYGKFVRNVNDVINLMKIDLSLIDMDRNPIFILYEKFDGKILKKLAVRRFPNNIEAEVITDIELDKDSVIMLENGVRILATGKSYSKLISYNNGLKKAYSNKFMLLYETEPNDNVDMKYLQKDKGFKIIINIIN